MGMDGSGWEMRDEGESEGRVGGDGQSFAAMAAPHLRRFVFFNFVLAASPGATYRVGKGN